MRSILVLLSLFVGSLASAQSPKTIWLMAGQSLLFLGSEDLRQGGGVALDFEMPWNRLNWRRHRGQFLLEGYMTRTHTFGGEGRAQEETSNAYGILANARYYSLPQKGGVLGFFEFGWGLQYTERRSEDLDERLNSSPNLGGGYIWPNGSALALRLLHISNAGLGKRNQGQNQIWLMFGTRL